MYILYSSKFTIGVATLALPYNGVMITANDTVHLAASIFVLGY
jgi:hypothetical protein